MWLFFQVWFIHVTEHVPLPHPELWCYNSVSTARLVFIAVQLTNSCYRTVDLSCCERSTVSQTAESVLWQFFQYNCQFQSCFCKSVQMVVHWQTCALTFVFKSSVRISLCFSPGGGGATDDFWTCPQFLWFRRVPAPSFRLLLALTVPLVLLFLPRMQFILRRHMLADEQWLIMALGFSR